jgi:DNA-binding NarL/FixJ family response regulator
MDGSCPVCDGEPRVLVVMRHPTMRVLTRELLEREFNCWIATEADTDEKLTRALDRVSPDLMIIDAREFPSCCPAALDHIDADRVIVIGPEPDPSYEAAALGHGAGAWLARDRVGEDLAGEMRRIMGCVHDPCPPGHSTLSPVNRGSASTGA